MKLQNPLKKTTVDGVCNVIASSIEKLKAIAEREQANANQLYLKAGEAQDEASRARRVSEKLSDLLR